MKFGFLIDHRKCIGCHACSVACKEEHQVPLGVYRTWVKYVEKGAFPNTRRLFTVLRCNHCEDAPCVTICPVTALYKRSDGIVDFDPNVCIGCKACMQACPYDALYIDPHSNTAAKCNFCAHRVEAGLQPSCQIVCPTQAIVSGDLDDPTSYISYLTARAPGRVRKPEKGTKPQLFYIDADESSLTPMATVQPSGFGMWSQVISPEITDLSMPLLPGAVSAPAASDLLQDLSAQAGKTVYNVGHAVPWGKKVSLYIWTKSMAAGAFFLSAIGGGRRAGPRQSWPGSEAAVLLAMANVILQEGRFNGEFLRRWVNWEDTLLALRPDAESTFDNFLAALKAHYATYTPAYAERESGVAAALIVQVARAIAAAGTAFAAHVWRSAASGNEGGWQVARCLEFLSVLTGSVGTRGGTSPNTWDKFVAAPFKKPAPQNVWNELLYPKEYPLAHHEMSFLLPHFLKAGRGRVDVYFTRAYNPVWTNPDGASWIEVLKDERLMGLHAALTPVWSETAWFADYVLPMGTAAERHDLMSQETQAGSWIGLRQPVLRVVRDKLGQPVRFTYEANPGEVWEEDEFWIELSWRLDPDGSLGVRQHFESPYRPGEKLTIDEYYQWIFEHSVPGLPEAAVAQGLAPLAYMRKYGAFEVQREVYNLHDTPLSAEPLTGAEVDPVMHLVRHQGKVLGVEVDGKTVVGFGTPSRKLELFSPTLHDWHWPEHTMPGYIKSHVHRDQIDHTQGEYVLLPTFRLPTLIHTRSGNAKWLYEIAHTNPLWVHPRDAERLAVEGGALVKVHTETGYFIIRVWVTEAIRPGVVACSHHLGRWRLDQAIGGERWSTALADLQQVGPGQWRLRQGHGIEPFHSADPDADRVWWKDAGVHQNLTFPVQPDPVSAMHCWQQKVRVEHAAPTDCYGDVCVDTTKAFQVYEQWRNKTRPAPGPDGRRRPLWFGRAVRPSHEAYRLASTPSS